MQLQSGLDDPLRRRFRRRVPLEQLVDDAGAEFGRRGAILGATDANEVGADEAVVASELDERLEEFGAGAVVQETALARTMAGRPARLEREIGLQNDESVINARSWYFYSFAATGYPDESTTLRQSLFKRGPSTPWMSSVTRHQRPSTKH